MLIYKDLKIKANMFRKEKWFYNLAVTKMG
jgi:hypothetical protein